MTSARRQFAAFTLTELLVVIGVIGMLVGILLPAVMAARMTARRTWCQSNLHQIGIALDRYVDIQGSRGIYPYAAMMPSINEDRPSLNEVLARFIESNRNVFACPADHIDRNRPGNESAKFDTYYEREGLSYEYPAFRLEGKTRPEILRGRGGQRRSAATVWLIYDYDAFHAPRGELTSRNILYADGHVTAD